MGWVRIDDSFYDHPKFHAVGALGQAAWIAGLAWANRNLSDGFIPRRAIAGLINCDGLGFYTSNMSGRDAEPADGVDELVTAGLWYEVEGGWQIHDYLDYQPSAAEVKAQREKHASRQAQWRKGRSSVSDTVSSTVTDSGSDELVTRAPNPNPNPNREGQGMGRKNRAAQLPDPFPITDEMRTWAFSKGISVDLDAETEQFADHHRAKGSTAKDWVASWRTWIRNAQKWSRNGTRSRPSNMDDHAALIRRLDNGHNQGEIA